MGRGEGLTFSLATTPHDAGLHIVLVWQWSLWMGAIVKNVASNFCNIEIKHYFVIISAVKYLEHLS